MSWRGRSPGGSRGPSRLAVLAVTAAAAGVGAGVLAVADRGAEMSEVTGGPASTTALGAPERSGVRDRAAPVAGSGPLAVDQRGCGWYFAYEPGLLRTFGRSPGVADLEPEQRRLLRAAVIGNTDRMRSALAAGAPADVVAPGFPYTPLTVSVSSQCISAVELLLREGADPDLRLPGENPPLVVAVLVDDPPSAAALLEAGADPTVTGADGVPVRDLARILDRDAIVDLLAERERPSVQS